MAKKQGLTPLQHVLNALGSVKGHAVGMPTPPAASFDVDKVINDQLKVQSQRLEVLKNIVGREAVLNKTVTFAVESARAQQVIQDKITAALRTRSEKILGATGVAAGLGGLGGIGGVGGALGGLMGGVGGAAAGGAVAQTLAGFVKAANPAAMERFDLVLRDVAGTIGQSLIPVIDALIPFVKLFGDFLASILPSADEVGEALGPLGGLLDDMREALAVIAPVIHDVLVVALKAFAFALEVATLPLRLIAELFGMGGGKKLADSTGKGFRGVQFQQQEQFAHSVYQAALMAPPGAKAKGEYHSPLDAITNILKDILKFVGGIADKLGVVFKSMADTVQDVVKEVMDIPKQINETVDILKNLPGGFRLDTKAGQKNIDDFARTLFGHGDEVGAEKGQAKRQFTHAEIMKMQERMRARGEKPGWGGDRAANEAKGAADFERGQREEARRRALDGFAGGTLFAGWMEN